MEVKHLLKVIVVGFICMVVGSNTYAQRYLSEYDSTLFVRDTMRSFMRRMENLHFSGYIQPQFQVAQQKGAPSYEGGDFYDSTNNRFMLRRARLKVDYILPFKNENIPQALFTFQIDATERGVNVRDMFTRLYLNKRHSVSFTTGLFARPFGYEINLSSAYRESPERGRMSQILMPTERDLGVMISYQPRGFLRKIMSLDAGVFNGQGLSGTTDFDSFKDIISRLKFKPMGFSKSLSFAGGLSLLYGGWQQSSAYRYRIKQIDGTALFIADSSRSNIGRKAPRHYYGADVQLVKKGAWGNTEVRAEYWWGTQSGTAITTRNPGTLPEGPTYVRNFDGAFIYLLQNIVNQKWEAIIKWDWYDPNTKVAAAQIGKGSTNLTEADIKFSTLGFGITRYINDNLKLLVYYSKVNNETTLLQDYTSDIKDDVFTFRLQMRF